jgi:hypothetical protein
MKGVEEEQNQTLAVGEISLVEIAVIEILGEILGGDPDDRFLIRTQEKNCAMSLLHG